MRKRITSITGIKPNLKHKVQLQTLMPVQVETEVIDLKSSTAKSTFSKVSTTTSTPIGNGPNGYSCGFSPLTAVDAHEGMNTVSFIHRSDFTNNGDNTSGSLRYDVSRFGLMPT